MSVAKMGLILFLQLLYASTVFRNNTSSSLAKDGTKMKYSYNHHITEMGQNVKASNRTFEN